MKRLSFFLFLCLLCVFFSFAQNPERFFREGDLINVGTFYYPEHWDESQWERDFKKMAEMGFEYVHMAEFAWAFLEPEEGTYDFEWLDKAIDLAGKHGLKVMLCTPTATTPVWMGLKYPETYLLDSKYMRKEHGSRQNQSTSNPDFQRLSKNIVTEMAKRYGQNPHVWGWQLDNEPGAKEDYSQSAQKAFTVWVKEKYKTIEELNKAWGTAFWSITYSSFDEIKIPNASSIDWWGFNQHALLDFRRFNADVQADFLNIQADILRKYISPKQFITTNYVNLTHSADPRRSDKLDFQSFTCYLNYGNRNLGDLGFRMGDYQAIAFGNDYFRPIDGVTGVLEIQPGQVNWGRINSMLLPGAVRMWLWHNYAAGSSLASSYRFRQPLYGVEQYHNGMITTDGVTPSQGGKDYMRFIDEIGRLRKEYKQDPGYPSELTARKTAILWSHENWWDHGRQPQSSQWDLMGHVKKYHGILKTFGAPVDMVSEQDDFTKYPFLLVPAYQQVDEELVEKWKEYASQGGHLVITCRTGTKTRDGHFWEGKFGLPIHDLIGADVENYDQLLENANGTIKMGQQVFSWNNWADILTINNKDVETWAELTDQFYAPKPAVISRKLGKGTITYIAVDSDNGDLERAALESVFSNAKVPVENYPTGVYVYWRDGFWIAVNYTSKDRTIDIPAKAKIIIGEKTLAPAGVVVWKE